MRAAKLALSLLSLSLGSAAQAGVIDLGSMIGGANLYAIRDVTATSSDVEGAVVAGGNVTVSSYSINANNRPAFGQYAVVAGGNLSVTSGSINHGGVYVGGTTSMQWAATPTALPANPVDFAAAEQYYKSLTRTIADLDATGVVAPLWSGVKVSGSGNGGVDVFNVSADLFRTSSSWTLQKLTAGQTLIFNISGDLGTFNDGGVSFEPLSAYNVLFNFHEAKNVNVKGVIGSVLAPYATVNANWGVINGNVIVDTWNSTIQVNANHYFPPVDVPGFSLPPGSGGGGGHAEVPEPGALALLLAGLCAAGFAYRARRAA